MNFKSQNLTRCVGGDSRVIEFPSPRPSLEGRGRILDSQSAKPARLEISPPRPGCSLSLGERVGVRGIPVHPASTASGVPNPSNSLMLRNPLISHSERGVALVITLILLSVIAFMAIAFLVLSYGQRAASTTATDQALARQAADAALGRAQMEVLASIMANHNAKLYDLCVSTNYINGFFTSLPPNANSYTNVSYTYTNGKPLGLNDLYQNLENLLYDPRPPVCIITNRALGSNDFRYYIDLNQNGRFEPTGLQPVVNPLGTYYDTNGNIISQITPGNTLSNFVIGDPQWIGGLEYPDRPHGPDNKFLFRYAYLAVPVSKTLDVNYIHNQAYTANSGSSAFDQYGKAYNRNEGVGTWEINLAAFLYDLNTNVYGWGNGGNPPYQYTNIVPPTSGSRTVGGGAFVDSASILAYRYGTNLSTLLSASALGLGNVFVSDGIDGYSLSNFVTSFSGPDPDSGHVTRPWSGANNINHFFTPSELLNALKTSTAFVQHLHDPGTNNGTYDRYTFYRLLSQLGSDSSPEPQGTINLNYDNLVQTNALGVASATNLYPWRPADFFTNAANAMLAKAGYTFVTTNIQVYPTNYYASSVHRILQLAANIYDATTNRPGGPNGTAVSSNGFPSVFRPLFRRTGDGRVVIAGYREVTNSMMAYAATAPTMVDFGLGLNTNGTIKQYGVAFDPSDQNEAMVAGVPLVIGARKGFPNFNEFLLETEVAVARKLEFTNRSSNPTVLNLATNQMYFLSISNAFGVEAWNPYTNPYVRSLQMMVTVGAYTTVMTNINATNYGVLFTNNPSLSAPGRSPCSLPMPPPLLSSPSGPAMILSGTPSITSTSFVAPFHPDTNHFVPLPAASFSSLNGCFVVPYQTSFESLPTGPFPAPHWFLVQKKRVLFILVDTVANRIVDYVNLAADDVPSDLTTPLFWDSSVRNRTNYFADGYIGSMWLTNRGGPNFDSDPRFPTFGILNQIAAGLGRVSPSPGWTDLVPPFKSTDGAINFFRTNLLLTNAIGTAQGPLYLTNRFYSPYVPGRTNYIYTWWQANDPLVHYTVNDLLWTNSNFLSPTYRTFGDIGGLDPAYLPAYVPVGSTDPLNARYEPWGGHPGSTAVGTTDYQLAVKDPMVTCADDWDFPTNKFPNPGWLGRIHRGTPWQTVYLKAAGIDLPTWESVSGNPQILTNLGQIDTRLIKANVLYADASFTFPTNDWRLLDIFSTAFNDNASLGKLSINQSGLAAWSAVLGGVVALTNVTADDVLASSPNSSLLTNAGIVIPPAGPYDPYAGTNLPPLVRIVNGINNTRATLTNQNQTFQRLGEILAVPELTVGAPYFTNGYWAGVSPFLNLGSTRNPSFTSLTVQQTSGLNDAAYERIPQQILGLIKCEDKPRFVIYSWGQALKPADHSIVQASGSFFGLCTNYQITAETATRAVVRIESQLVTNSDSSPSTNFQAVIENFNVLPPE